MKVCTGCGVCALECRKEAISINWENGDYVSHIDESKCVNCGLCNKVCPFDKRNITNFNRNNMLGDVLNCYVGEAIEFREKATSGGALSALCKYLLERNLVDSILSVGVGSGSRLFEYIEIKTIADIDKCSRSAYYPVSLDSVQEILKSKNEEKIAVVGLPCVCSALNNLKKVDIFYKNKIKYLIGIVCSHTPNAEMVTHIAYNVGLDPTQIRSIGFRDKSVGDLYGLSIVTKDGVQHKYSPTEWGLNGTFLTKEYIRASCLVCSDVYAHDADIVFMDAWKKGFSDTLGTSLVLSRSTEMDMYVREMEWNFSKTEISRAIEAQDYGHLIDFKIEGGRYRRSKFGYSTDTGNIPFKEIIESKRLLTANKILIEHLQRHTSFDDFRKMVKARTSLFVFIRKSLSLLEKILRRNRT